MFSLRSADCAGADSQKQCLCTAASIADPGSLGEVRSARCGIQRLVRTTSPTATVRPHALTGTKPSDSRLNFTRVESAGQEVQWGLGSHNGTAHDHKGTAHDPIAGVRVILYQPGGPNIPVDWAARWILAASKLLHLEVKLWVRLGKSRTETTRWRYRDGIISVVFPGDDGGIHAELACAQRSVGTLDAYFSRPPSIQRIGAN